MLTVCPGTGRVTRPVTGVAEQEPASLQELVVSRGAAQTDCSLQAASLSERRGPAEHAEYVSQMNQSDEPLLGSWCELKKGAEGGLRYFSR